MTPEEAAGLLGVAIDADPVAVRSAYIRGIRLAHPDVAGVAATEAAATLIAAYEVMRDGDSQDRTRPGKAAVANRDETAPSDPTTRGDDDDPAPTDVVTLVDDDTVGFAFPAEEVFALLVAVADELGEISYVDADNTILEAIVAFRDEPVCSMVLSLQGRADRVEAFCTIEALDGSRPPPTAAVVALLFERLRRRLSPDSDP